MPKTVYYNGKYYKSGRAVLPISDRSIFFGDAVYDAMIGRCGGLFLCREHLERLLSNAKKIGLPLAHPIEQLCDISYNVVKKSKLSEYFLYIQLSRCSEERVHAYPKEQKCSLLITVKPYTPPSPEYRLKLVTVNDPRHCLCNVKTVNLLPAVLASHVAESAGCDEAVFVRDGAVTECAHSNVAIIKSGVIITHPDSPYILPGIAKSRLLAVAAELGVPVEERPISPDELSSADEVLVTSTTKLCLAACELNGCPVGGKAEDIFSSLQKRLFDEYAFWTM